MGADRYKMEEAGIKSTASRSKIGGPSYNKVAHNKNRGSLEIKCGTKKSKVQTTALL